MARKDQLFANYLKDKGVDLSRDFYSLNNPGEGRAEYSVLTDAMKHLGYSGKNSLGREPHRQFYYAAQRGEKKNKRDEPIANGASKSAANKAAGLSNG